MCVAIASNSMHRHISQQIELEITARDLKGEIDFLA